MNPQIDLIDADREAEIRALEWAKSRYLMLLMEGRHRDFVKHIEARLEELRNANQTN